MEKRGATMIMFADGDAIVKSGFDSVPRFNIQDVDGGETGSSCTSLANIMTAERIGIYTALKYRPYTYYWTP